MDAREIQIPTTIKDTSTIRFIQSLISLLIELEDRIKKLEAV